MREITTVQLYDILFFCRLLQCQLLYGICEESICCNFVQRFTPEKAFFSYTFSGSDFNLHYTLVKTLAFRSNLVVKMFEIIKYKLSRVVSQSRLRLIYINGLIALKILVVVLRYHSHKACSEHGRVRGDSARSGAFGLCACEWRRPTA